MQLSTQHLHDLNRPTEADHQDAFDYLASRLSKRGLDANQLVDRLNELQIAIPSWALGTGGTRFGRFSGPGEPGTLEAKLDDVGLLHKLTNAAGAISLHIPWDVPEDYAAIRQRAEQHGIRFDAVNSNTFQDQPGQASSYKFGSLNHIDSATRQQAIEHNQHVIEVGDKLGSKSLTVWLADGSNFPGQVNLRGAWERTLASLREIYSSLPSDWKLLVEYKPYEPNFYSTTIMDWGSSYTLATELGEQAYTLVDLGHHLPNTNIENIVALLMARGKLGGFHFNDSKYGDDDLTVGSIKPYQLFLIFNELVYGNAHLNSATTGLTQPAPFGGSPGSFGWMIDASHNVKDPLEDLIQSLEAIRLAYARALLVDQDRLEELQRESDVAACQELLQDAFRTDLRPLLAEARRRAGAALDPFAAYRKLEVRQQLAGERGNSVATGL